MSHMMMLHTSTTDEYNNNDCASAATCQAAASLPSDHLEHDGVVDSCSSSEPTTPPTALLQTHDDRWKHMSRLAGSHCQKDSVFYVTRRIASPLCLRSGMPPQSAKRIRELHLSKDCFEAGASTLPEWLDVISQTFCGLQHLYLGETSNCTTEEEDAARRMRRLYILYRLPDLESIDGQLVQESERQVARPNDPNGHPVKKTDWVVLSSPSRDHAEDYYDCTTTRNIPTTEGSGTSPVDASVEVSIRGFVVKPMSADPPDEPALPPLHEPSQQQRDEAQAQALIMLENKHRERLSSSLLSVDLDDNEQHHRAAALSCGVVRAALPTGLAGACTRNQKYLAMDEEVTTLPYCATLLAERSNSEKRLSPQAVEAPPPPPPSPPKPSPLLTPKRLVRSSSTPTRLSTTSSIVPKTPPPPPQASPSRKCRNSPSHSLSSPFPMQFRNRTNSNNNNNNNNSPPALRREEEIRSDCTLSDLVMDTIDLLPDDSATPTNTTTTPSNTPSNTPRSTGGKSRRPPTFPGRRSSVLPKAVVLHNKRMERRAKKRRERFMRGVSVLDEEEDDDDEDVSSSESDEGGGTTQQGLTTRRRNNATE